jgi:hypothetical protein
MSDKEFKAEPIAIVGVGCRFSGSATNPEALWDMLSKGTTGWTKTASHRFNLNTFWHPNGDNKGTVCLSQNEDDHGLQYLTRCSSTPKASISLSKTQPCSTMTSSASAAWKQRLWTPSNEFCWRLPTKLSKTRASPWMSLEVHKLASGVQSRMLITNRSLLVIPISLLGTG